MAPYRTVWREGDESISTDGHSVTFARACPEYDLESTETTFYLGSSPQVRRQMVQALAKALDVPIKV